MISIVEKVWNIILDENASVSDLVTVLIFLAIFFGAVLFQLVLVVITRPRSSTDRGSSTAHLNKQNVPKKAGIIWQTPGRNSSIGS